MVQKSVTPKIMEAPRKAESKLEVWFTSAWTISTPLEAQVWEAEEEMLRVRPRTSQPGVWR